MHSTNAGQVVMGGMRKQGEQTMGSSQVNNILLWSLLLFLPPNTCPDSIRSLTSLMMDYETELYTPLNSSLPKLTFLMVYSTTIKYNIGETSRVIA